MADKYDLIFHNQISLGSFTRKFQKIGYPKNLIFPSEGNLPGQIFVTLLDILKLSSISNQVFIYQRVPHTIWKENKPEDLVECSYEEVLVYFSDDFIGYLYSSDKSWIIYTDTDLAFTIIGGNKGIIGDIIDSKLEAVECDLTTRVDDFSDNIN